MMESRPNIVANHGNAGGDYVLVAVGNLQRMEVTGRSVHRSREHVVAALYRRGLLTPVGERLSVLGNHRIEISMSCCRSFSIQTRSHRYAELRVSHGSQFKVPDGCLIDDLIRRRQPADERLSHDVIETAVQKGQGSLTRDGAIVLAVMLPPHSAHFKDVNEVGIVLHLYPKLNRLQVVILECDLLEKRALTDRLLSMNMDGVLRQIKRFPQMNVAGGQFNL